MFFGTKLRKILTEMHFPADTCQMTEEVRLVGPNTVQSISNRIFNRFHGNANGMKPLNAFFPFFPEAWKSIFWKLDFWWPKSVPSDMFLYVFSRTATNWSRRRSFDLRKRTVARGFWAEGSQKRLPMVLRFVSGPRVTKRQFWNFWRNWVVFEVGTVVSE